MAGSPCAAGVSVAGDYDYYLSNENLIFVELQHASDRLEHLYGWVAIATPFEPQVVVGGDAGEHGDLLTP